ncbi:Predicted Zn-dependent peptidase [Myxococcus fulvus]|uniref:Peptidase M16 n=1 Tax=Myxococcus fulvus TaxID=33 RepID=A0A511TFY8_MYXFU|nr:pitrilysin family protein [Myxococcus fulvus]AKF84305.1 peptidase M16 [Myxococcus fulvus 124B02]GEN13080.1 peptidase M16 [Myxococcus fulvus]SEU40981.1 Predicted Zn-dependent peptidase [Myxococcus fulvus]
MTFPSLRNRLVASSLLVFGLVAAPVLAAPAAKQAPPAPAAPKPFNVPQRTSFKLDNGLEVSLLPYGDMPKVAIQLVVETGNIHEKADEVWLTDLAGKLLKEGTTTRSAEQVAQAAAELGGELDVGTQEDESHVSIEVLSEFAPQAVALVADVIQNPAFPASEVERLKGDLMRDLAVYRTMPQVLANEMLAKALYGDHPYGRRLATEEQLKRYTRDQAVKHYEANVGAARSRLYVVGRFEPAQVEKVVREAFSGWRAGPARLKNVPKQKVAKSVLFLDRPGSVQSTVRVAAKALPPTSEDAVTLDVLNTMLGGYFSSRVTSNIREKKGYAYSPYSNVSEHPEDAYWVQNADVTTANTGDSLKEILKEVDTLRKTPPPAEELRDVQNYLAGAFLLENSSRMGIIYKLRYVDLHGLPETYLKDYVSRVMAVTPEQVRAVAAKVLAQDAMTIVIVGDMKVVKPQLKVLPPKLR